jgi:hypothetical protein
MLVEMRYVLGQYALEMAAVKGLFDLGRATPVSDLRSARLG